MGNIEEALKYFENYLALTKELYEANPHSITLFEGLAISYYKLAMICKTQNDDEKGKSYFEEWKKMISYLAENIPQVPKYGDWNIVEY